MARGTVPSAPDPSDTTYAAQHATSHAQATSVVVGGPLCFRLAHLRARAWEGGRSGGWLAAYSCGTRRRYYARKVIRARIPIGDGDAEAVAVVPADGHSAAELDPPGADDGDSVALGVRAEHDVPSVGSDGAQPSEVAERIASAAPGEADEVELLCALPAVADLDRDGAA